jgi:hypothetical protein
LDLRDRSIFKLDFLRALEDHCLHCSFRHDGGGKYRLYATIYANTQLYAKAQKKVRTERTGDSKGMEKSKGGDVSSLVATKRHP